ncbi:MAG: tetratricopeptide repeat protein [Parvularculaceae bacterium]
MFEQKRLLRELFEQSVDLLNRNEAGAAERLLRQGLGDFPNEPNLSRMLGVALMQQGRYQDAETELVHVVRMIPEFGEAHESLAEVQFSLGRLADAIKSLEKAVRINPKSETATFRLAEMLALAGRGPEADAAFERAFELNPSRRTLVEGMGAFRAKNYEEARAKFRAVLRQDPDNVDALRLLGVVCIRQKNHSDAEALLSRAVALAPQFAFGWNNLGLAQSEQGKYAEAEKSFAQAIRLTPRDPEVYATQASSYVQAGRHDDALVYYKKALALFPDHFPSLLGLGHTLKTIGSQDEAIDAYRACARVRPDYGDVFWSLANLKTFRFEPDEIATMEAQLAGPDLEKDAAISFRFALAKAYEDKKDYDKAFENYARGNEMKRALVQYDPLDLEQVVDGLIDAFTPDFLAERTSWGCDDPSPILVLGLPRSGSTLIEQILASHSMVEGTSELPDLMRLAAKSGTNRADGLIYPHSLHAMSPDEIRELGEGYINTTRRQRTDRPRFIDKMPNNFPHVGLMHLILPNAKIIDARRHPLDSCLGSWKQLFANGQTFSYDFFDLAEYYQQYLRIMDHWDRVLPGKVLRVNYEDVVGDLETQARRMLDHCGLPWEDSVLEFYNTKRPVRTASSEQVRQPIYSSAVNFWKNYERQLEPLIDHLEPVLRNLPPDARPQRLR